MAEYAEFRIRIERDAPGGPYRVEASGLGADARGTFESPFSDEALENFVLKVGRTRRGVRKLASPEWESAKSFGEGLFGALIQGRVLELYREALSSAQATRTTLRVTLALSQAPELAEIPWEYLYDRPNFLSISASTPVVRYLDVSKPVRPVHVELPIRILAVVSAPSDAEVLDAPEERRKLETALQPLIDANAVAIDWLEEATLLALSRKLRPDTYHILHFIGHGGFDEANQEGALLFEDEKGNGSVVSGEQLATVLNDKAALQLVFLNSCEGARTSRKDPFSGVAASLIEREIPAVIGMQFEITDRAAILFAGDFYASLAEGRPVDVAVTQARLTIYADKNDVEWGTPVLFMRVADGQLFDIADAGTLPRVESGTLPPKGPVPAGECSRRGRPWDRHGRPHGCRSARGRAHDAVATASRSVAIGHGRHRSRGGAAHRRGPPPATGGGRDRWRCARWSPGDPLLQRRGQGDGRDGQRALHDRPRDGGRDAADRQRRHRRHEPDLVTGLHAGRVRAHRERVR